VIASRKWRPLVANQLAPLKISGDCVIDEPEGRNTAPAVALGIVSLLARGASSDDVVIVCPSDHMIQDEARFAAAVAAAEEAAKSGNIVTFGIKPARPDTGFGYIRTSNSGSGWLIAEEFVEKPDEATAKAYIENGAYYWNGGIFCFRVSDMITAYREHFPESAAIFDAVPGDVISCFRSIPKQSIDYAIMEKARNIVCVPLDAGWSDVGSWDAVYENSGKDADGNAVSDCAVMRGCRDNLVVGCGRLICGVDIDSMIVVDTPDALFIAPRGSSHRVRGVVRELADAGREEIMESPQSARPWGTYKVLSKGERHKIKKIEVLPGERLSLQYHIHRSEHWVVVKGAALVTVRGMDGTGAEELLIHEGESFFVPKGKLHRLENPGKIPLEIIEVQIGEYVGEDDITRVTDDYDRA
jgi:mannose-1-phosphate guanylyltransferase/mannose-6-phosphate isomerase